MCRIQKRFFVALQVVMVALLVPGVCGAASFLEEEAGISAWGNVQFTDFATSKKNAINNVAFRNIEKNTDEYFVGSVPIPTYDETHDVHVFVNSSGQIIAYYLNNEPASKIINWKSYDGDALTGNKLKQAIVNVCSKMNVSPPVPINYYDFRTNANRIKIIADISNITNVEDSFKIKIPDPDTMNVQISFSHALHITGNILSGYVKYKCDFATAQTISNIPSSYGDSWQFQNKNFTDVGIANVPENEFFEIYFGQTSGNNYTGVSYVGIVILYNE